MNTKRTFPLPPKENLTERLIFRISKKDLDNLNKKCKEHSVSMSELIRYFIKDLLYPKAK